MKILFLNLFYYPMMVGGAEHSLMLLAEGLVKEGYEIAVATYDGKKNRKIEKEWINGVLVYRMYNPIFIKKIFNKKTNILEKIQYYNSKYYSKQIEKNLSSIIDEFTPDIFHTQNYFPTSLIRIAKRKSIPTVHTTRDYFFLDPQSNINSSPKLIEIMHRKYEKFFLDRYLDVVTSPSEILLNKHKQAGYFRKTYNTVIYNAVKLDNEETNNILNEKNHRKSKLIKFIYVGALNKVKGVDIMLKAVSLINSQNFCLYICGDGQLEDFVKEAALQDSRINYLGKKSKEEIKKLYIESDVSIVPSVWEEPFGRVVIESAQYGCPVIGSNRGGVREIIEKSLIGECYQADSAEALSKEIEKFMNRDFIHKFYINIKTNIGLFSLNTQINNFSELYSKLVVHNTKG